MTESKEAQVEQVEDVKRWTAKRKSAVVLDLIKGKATAIDVARNRGRDRGLGAALPRWGPTQRARRAAERAPARRQRVLGRGARTQRMVRVEEVG